MKYTKTTVAVAEIRANDRFIDPTEGSVAWTAIHDARSVADDVVLLKVQYRDGGNGNREWHRASEKTLEVDRPEQD